MMNSNSKNEKGITMYLSVFLLGATLTTALFVSRTMVKEFTISKETADSMRAVYVADSAIEFTLYQTRIKAVDVVNLETGGVTALGIITSGSHYAISTANCAGHLFAGHATSKKCKIDTYTSVLQGVNNCPTFGDPNIKCTHIVVKGTHGSINRALEIIYPNL